MKLLGLKEKQENLIIIHRTIGQPSCFFCETLRNNF
jgi:hypothetical protein